MKDQPKENWVEFCGSWRSYVKKNGIHTVGLIQLYLIEIIGCKGLDARRQF